MLYSQDRLLSKNSKIIKLNAQEVEARFDFKLLHEDLANSYYKSAKFLLDYRIGVLNLDVMSSNTKNLVVHNISKEMGHIVSTLIPIAKNTIVAEYLGARLGASEPKIDDPVYNFITDQSPFWNLLYQRDIITQDDYNTSYNTTSYISAKYYGNIARFFHHAPEHSENPNIMTANLASKVLPVSKTLMKVFLFTTRDVKAFEPLCFDYGTLYNQLDTTIYLDAKTYLPITNMDDEKDIAVVEDDYSYSDRSNLVEESVVDPKEL